MLQRSTWSGLLLSAAVLAACGLTGVSWAQTAPATAPATDAAATAPAATAPATAEAATAAPAGPAAPTVDPKLVTLADDFLHYSLINNNDLAKSNGQALLDANPAPETFLHAFEAAANGRSPRDIMQQDMHRAPVSDDEKEPYLKDIAGKLLDKLDEGYRTVARDPVRIRADIERLAEGPRPYQNARERLMAAGEFAAPLFLEYLQNPQKQDLHPYIVRVMGEIGRPLLNPLIEELRVTDPILKVEIVTIIGQIRYPQALPELRAIQADPNSNEQLKAAADNAIHLIDRSGAAAAMSPSDLSLKAADNYYDKRASYQPLHPDEKTNPIWIFAPSLNNVQMVPVPTAVWNSSMAIRMAEATVRIDPDNSAAISLWMAASLRRDLQLPAGATDPTKKGDDDAIIAAGGPKYLNPVLARALDDHDAALALRAIDNLDLTAGTPGMTSGGDNAPLVRALAYPDRSVRFRAAFTLAAANPTSQYPSFFRVVPIMSEAINSNGQPTALVVSPNEDERNRLTAFLRGDPMKYTVYSGDSMSSAVDAARRAPSVDLIVVPDGAEVARAADIAKNDYRMIGAPVLVTTTAGNLPTLKAQLIGQKGYGAIDGMGVVDVDLATAVAAAQADAGNVPLDAENATKFATQSLSLLAMLAADHHSIYSVMEAVPTLIDALKDKRPEIATGAAKVLGKMNNPDAQKALAKLALNDDLDGALRTVYFEELANSAKVTGNVLDASVINSLIKFVGSDASDPKLRLKAAVALGALNVPSNQASALLLQQAK